MSKRIAKVLWWGVLGLVALICAALLAVQLALSSTWGREQLRTRVNQAVSEALSARFEIQRIDAASLWFVRGSGLRLTRGQERIASLERFAIHFDLLSLLGKRIEVTSATLDRPYLDLGAPLDQGGGGLLGLLEQSSKDAPATASKPSELVFALHRVRVRSGRVEAPRSGARFALTKLETRASIDIGSKLEARVDWLGLEVLRDGESIAAVRGSQLRYGGSGALGGRLRLEMPTTQISAAVQVGAPGALGGRRVYAKVFAQQVSPESLAALGVDADWLETPVDLAVNAWGTTRDGDFDAWLSTKGGSVELKGRLSQAQRITARLSTAGLDTRRVLRDGLDPLAVTLEIDGNAARDFSAAEVALELRDGSYGNAPLPHTELRGRWSRAAGFALDGLTARDPDAGGELRVHGYLRPDGQLEAKASAHADALARVPLLHHFAPGLSGAVDVSANVRRAPGGSLRAQLELSATRPAFGAGGADSLQLHATGEGESLASARMHAQLHAAQFRYAHVRLVEAQLELSADPRRYMARGRFGTQGNLDIRVDRSGETFRAVGGADVALGQGQRLLLDLGRMQYQRRKLTLANLRLSVGKASARVDGWLEPQGRAQLSASLSVPDMAQLTQLVMEEPVAGQLELVAGLQGATRQPRVTLKGRYRCHELGGLRDAEVDLQARADMPTRRIDVEMQAKARHTGLNATIHTELRVAELSQSALERATHDITLEIERIPLTELSMFPTARLRVEAADLSGKFHVRGTLAKPQLSAKAETRARFYGDRSLLTLQLSADYADSQLALDLSATDGQGPLLYSRVKTELEPRGPLVRTAADFSRLLAQRAWEVELSLRARRVDELPAVHAVPVQQAAFPWRLSAHARLEHRPGAEPEGDFQMEALFQPALERENEPKCGAAGAPRLTLQAKMKDGELVSHARVRIASKDMLALEGHSRAPLDQWLGPVSPQPVDITATFDRLRFASLPVLCEELDGELSGSVKLARAITKKVELSAKLRASKVTWGQAPAFDAWIDAHADRKDMIARVDMKGAGGAATLTAKIPLDENARVPMPRLDAPARAEARLQEMNVASLLGGIPTISADSGRLDGVVKLSGTLAQPYLNGSLAMRKVSITLGKIGQRFEDVTGRLTLNGRSVHLAQTRVHDRDGRLDISGDLTMQALDRFHAEFKASAKRYPIRRDGVVLGSFDGKLHVVAQIAPERNTIDLALRDATVELSQDDFGTVQSLKPNREVSFLDARASDPPPENDASETVVHIDASEPMWIRRDDFSVQVSTRMTIVSRGDTPEITGTLEIRRGVIELIGQLFDIDRGRIEFSGGHEVEPTLDLVARRKMPGGGTVTVEAQGPLHDPRLSFLVDDKAVPAEEALAALSGGGGAGSASMQDQLSSVATGMAAGVLTMGARRQLGEWVPMLAVESGARETRLRAGVEARRLIPKFLRRVVVDAYVEGMVSSVQDPNETGSDGQASAQTQAAALLELRFPHRLVGEAQYGPGQRWSADLSWEP